MSTGLTLYEIEENLQVLLDQDEDVPEPMREEYALEVAKQYAMARDKRDAYAAFLAYCESQEAACKKEEARLKALRQRFEGARERAERSLVTTIESLGVDAKGKRPRLDGNTCQLSLAKCPVSVEVSDPVALPGSCKRVLVEMSSAQWQLDFEYFAERGATLERILPAKQVIKILLEAGESVPGARLVTDKNRLVRK